MTRWNADDWWADMQARMDSPDWDTAWGAYAESFEWFDGEPDITAAHKRKFRAEWEAKQKS